MNDADRRRAALLAHQTRRDNKLRTEVGLVIHRLGEAEKAARMAERDEEHAAISRWLLEATDLYRGLPGFERVAS